MDHQCPHCGKDLLWKLVRSRPLRGVVLDKEALGATIFCPFCGGALGLNKHKYEPYFASSISLAAAATILLGNNLKNITVLFIGLATMCIIAFGYAWYWRKHLSSWRRYVPYQL